MSRRNSKPLINRLTRIVAARRSNPNIPSGLQQAVLLALSVLTLAGMSGLCVEKPRPAGRVHKPFAEILSTTIREFDASGRSVADVLIGLAQAYRLPMALEYVDRTLVTKPLKLKLRNNTLREVLTAAVSTTPKCEISFSRGVVEVYSPRGRRDPSNLLNTVIDAFDIDQVEPHIASADVFVALSRSLRPKGAVVNSIPVPVAPQSTVTVHVRNARVYEILNLITAESGNVIWVANGPPDRLSSFHGHLWSVYSFDENLEEVIIQDLHSLFATTK